MKLSIRQRRAIRDLWPQFRVNFDRDGFVYGREREHNATPGVLLTPSETKKYLESVGLPVQEGGQP